MIFLLSILAYFYVINTFNLMKTVTLVTEFHSENCGKYIVNEILNVLFTISCLISANLLCENYLREKYAHKFA